MTVPEFKQWVPPAIAPEGGSFWRAFSLTRMPWYLLTYRRKEAGCDFMETKAIAWESTLRNIVEQLGAEAVIELNCIRPAPGGTGKWVLRRVTELWLPADDELQDAGPLMFVAEGEADLYDSHHSKVSRSGKHRKVLLRISP